MNPVELVLAFHIEEGVIVDLRFRGPVTQEGIQKLIQLLAVSVETFYASKAEIDLREAKNALLNASIEQARAEREAE